MYKQLLIVKRSNDFKTGLQFRIFSFFCNHFPIATSIVEHPIPHTVSSDTKVIIKNIYAGLQGSDIIVSNGAVLYTFFYNNFV